MPAGHPRRLAERGQQWIRSQIATSSGGQGSFHGFKVAVAVIVFHFICKILVQFADILIPFIMALLIVSVLEPVKQVALSVLECTFLLFFRKIAVFRCCLREPRKERGNTRSRRSRDLSDLGELVKRFCLFISILFTLLLAGRVFWWFCRIVWLSGEAVNQDFEFYKSGVHKRQEQVKQLLQKVGLQDKVQLDMRHVAHYALIVLKFVAEFLTQHVFYTMSQVTLMAIFALFLLYSPVQRDFSPVSRGVIESMETYLKLKTLISLSMGITNGTALAIVGLEIPAAWGLMTFLANFIPNIGGPLMSVLPCVIALLDVRKTLYQVCAAFIAQFILHFTIANFVEPVIFGNMEEIHSVVVILGLSFFGYIWGISGMFLSVPLLFAIHAWLDTIARTPKYPMEARDDARFMMGMLEGTWLSDSLDNENEEQSTVNLLTGQIETVEAPMEAASGSNGARERAQSTEESAGGQRSGGAKGSKEVAEVKGPPMVRYEFKATCEALFEVFERETGEIRFQGLALRWVFLAVIYIVLFYGPDPKALIHSSGAYNELASAYNESTTLGIMQAAPSNSTSMAPTPTLHRLDSMALGAVSTTAPLVVAALTTVKPQLLSDGIGTAMSYNESYKKKPQKKAFRGSDRDDLSSRSEEKGQEEKESEQRLL